MLSTKAAANKDRRTHTADFQHRHFATLARIIRDAPDSFDRNALAVYFAAELSRTNSNFNTARFLDACKPE
ncbi:hypothetical protein [Caulobacter phage KcrB]|nr:hypothetical protein RW_GP010 [Caulobacter phage RW]WCA46314.1 hypothetical protein [Caulobacter phage KcrB]WCD56249.1 hypothetical protein [Caulobacter phage RLK]WNV48041.1 hypothetical protein GB2A_gp009 [Caulobacter phage GB2A]